MLLTKPGYPEEGELVLCTVTSVHYHSVFVMLDEYKKQGMIHISEVAPGRIRNIRDYVIEGKKIVCKVLGINKKRGYIDLSLRRVNEMEKKAKINEIKQEQKAEKIVEFLARKLGMDVKVLYEKIMSKIIKKYDGLYPFFEEIVIGKSSIYKLGIKNEILKELITIVKERIKLPEVKISGDLSLVTYLPNGIEIIKDILKKAMNVDKHNITIWYRGGGKYRIEVKASEYKKAEKIIEKATAIAIKEMEKFGEATFVRVM